MANIRSEEATAELHRKILTAATALFIQKGFERTTFVDIAKLSDVPKSKILYEFASKEEILSLLVTKFLDGVTKASDTVSKKLTDDKIQIFMANEVLQIYMAEMSDDMRNLYLAGYSMPKTSEEVLKRRTEILHREFGNMLPYLELKDFYELEIASMGIMRAYMSVPCTMYFTLEAKTDRLISTILKIYNIDNKRIEETKEFMKKIDFKTVAKKVIEDVFKELGIKTNK